MFLFFTDSVVRGTYIAYYKPSDYCKVNRYSPKLLDLFCEGMEILQGMIIHFRGTKK